MTGHVLNTDLGYPNVRVSVTVDSRVKILERKGGSSGKQD